MIEYMEEMKTKRLARELIQFHGQRRVSAIKLLRAYKVAAAPFTVVMPESVDFCAFIPIKEILDQPTDVNVDAESFVHLMPELGGMIERWREVITAEFVQEVKGGIKSLDANTGGRRKIGSRPVENLDESILQRIKLASTVYKCTDCAEEKNYPDLLYGSQLPDSFYESMSRLPLWAKEPFYVNPLWYPRVLGHRCLTKPSGFTLEESLELENVPGYRKLWSCELIAVDKRASKAAKAVVEACGMNPRVATADDMDNLDARLECLKCYPDDPERIAFGWRSAVRDDVIS